jgi:ubiquinol-cytochrome c reductase subunit 6
MFKHRLQECTDRVNSKPWTKETCNEELLDFLHCVDECVRELIKNIFSDSLFLIF